uniref:Uncharacterized protein n=1 Tax=Rhizophora mucronata TaxID=61149 RepID=A0A2P2N4B6_RHIMU
MLEHLNNYKLISTKRKPNSHSIQKCH